MTRQLAHHHEPPNPCPVCEAILAELAAVRLALLNAETEPDAAHAECARLPYPHYSAAELGVDEWAETHA